ncbi:hypothetical protein ACV1WV_06835 [Serratia marcescens]
MADELVIVTLAALYVVGFLAMFTATARLGGPLTVAITNALTWPSVLGLLIIGLTAIYTLTALTALYNKIRGDA